MLSSYTDDNNLFFVSKKTDQFKTFLSSDFKKKYLQKSRSKAKSSVKY